MNIKNTLLYETYINSSDTPEEYEALHKINRNIVSEHNARILNDISNLIISTLSKEEKENFSKNAVPIFKLFYDSENNNILTEAYNAECIDDEKLDYLSRISTTLKINLNCDETIDFCEDMVNIIDVYVHECTANENVGTLDLELNMIQTLDKVLKNDIEKFVQSNLQVLDEEDVEFVTDTTAPIFHIGLTEDKIIYGGPLVKIDSTELAILLDRIEENITRIVSGLN